jgi:hypothetical protein
MYDGLMKALYVQIMAKECDELHDLDNKLIKGFYKLVQSVKLLPRSPSSFFTWRMQGFALCLIMTKVYNFGELVAQSKFKISPQP